MAAAAGLRALGAKGSGWLRRDPWAPFTTGFCSGGRPGSGGRGRDPPSRGSGTASGQRPAWVRGCSPGGGRRDPGRERGAGGRLPTVPPHAETIILSEPKRRNALSLAMLKSLQSDILHEAESQDLKVIIISVIDEMSILTEGPVFSSGHDLKELTDEQGPDYHAEVMMLIQSPSSPCCDTAVPSDTSSFATPGVNSGLFCSTPAAALGRAVPSKVALEMLFTGEPISAQEALLHGLLSRVVPEEWREEETMRIARKVASLSQPVLSLGKAAFYWQLAQDLRTAYHLTSQTMVNNLGLPDGQEGVKAFLQKRKPVWSH
ncbi:hypothetical protein FD755_006230 [Muntiacus reevesi]|uniref:Enoyl-CoA hydratase domain-containing protein 3, mitochondrial n=1 Tax=Muntiacus reevesi TaxID=9886 RepID=A0A5J5N166_MUNRE|nr:hypothetical protein FD755_006230 [Muntiacus reevesi]